MKIGSLFSGYGGLDMGVQAVLGGDVSWFVEYDDAPSKILAHHWPDAPNYGDITTVDWNAVEPVDVLTGGFPCQDLSLAGRRAGMRPGTRSGLWADYLKAIDTLHPKLAVIENVRGLLSGCAESDSDMEPCPGCLGVSDIHRPAVRALGRVLGDLADIGYDAEWIGLRAADAGAPHSRFRVFVFAHPQGQSWRGDDRDDVSAGSGADRRDTDSGSGSSSDSGRLRGEEGRLATPGQATGGRSQRLAGGRGGASAVADPGGQRLAQQPGSAPAEEAGAEDRHVASSPRRRRSAADWGAYADTVERWARIVGRDAPDPVDDRGRLAVLATEFLMGLQAGHVSSPDIDITDDERRKALGNGVVPQQAELATSWFVSTSHSYGQGEK